MAQDIRRGMGSSSFPLLVWGTCIQARHFHIVSVVVGIVSVAVWVSTLICLLLCFFFFFLNCYLQLGSPDSIIKFRGLVHQSFQQTFAVQTSFLCSEVHVYIVAVQSAHLFSLNPRQITLLGLHKHHDRWDRWICRHIIISHSSQPLLFNPPVRS